MTEETIAAGEFKAKCLKLMAEVERTGQPLVITKRGKPLVKLVPYVTDKEPKSIYGCMESTAIFHDHIIMDETSEPAPAQSQSELITSEKQAQEAHDIIAAHEAELAKADAVSHENRDEHDAPQDVLHSEEGAVTNAPLSERKEPALPPTERRTDPVVSPKPQVIAKSEPPNHGLPIDNTPRKSHAAPIISPALNAEEEEALFVPAMEQQEEGDALADALREHEDESASDAAPANKQQLEKLFTSAWNRQSPPKE